MKILLLFPPDWLPSEPYLSLPVLASVLRPAGHKVVLKDINVEMYELMFSGTFLHHVKKRIGHELSCLQRASDTRILNAEEKNFMDHLLACNGDLFTRMIDDVEKAKATLRSQDFFDINKLEWAASCLHQTMSIISLAYYPAQICFPPFETDLVYKPYMSGKILEAIENDRVNVYRDVYRLLVEPVMQRERPDLVGISVVQQKQLIPTFTFCKMIKEKYPDTHITLGGNIITRIRDFLSKKKSALFNFFDTAILYEGESAFLELVDAIDRGKNDFSQLPNLIYRDENGIHTNSYACSTDITKLPPPDFDGLPLDKYFVPVLIIPYLATRGCYWGWCTFCDHSEGYVGSFRTKQVKQVIEEIQFLKEKYNCKHFHFTDESYPPTLFKKLSQKIVENKINIAWTTHLRFEESLLDDIVWKDAAQSGCKYLHFGFESGNERVLKFMNKATNLDAIRKILRMSAKYGIWNHCMGFFGFPGETREEAEDSIRFLHENKDYIHSVGFMTFVLGKDSPVAMEPKRYGVSIYKNPEWDLALNYYYTTNDGMGIREAVEVFEEFERNHDPKWDLRTYVREYIFLYVDHFQTNNLPQLYQTDNQKSFINANEE